MREFQIMVDPLGAVTVSGSSRLLGYGGEHNVARLNINFNDFEQSVFKDAGYYRLALGDYYSDALYLENGKLSYLVPFDAVTPPMIYCQIIGYTDKEGEPVKIAKSSVFTMEVKFSKVPRAAISNSTDVFERTLASCEVASKSSLEASNEARLYAESAALSMEKSEESSVIADESANLARVAAEEVKETLVTLENVARHYNNVANAIKRTAKGNAVSVSDVSPIEHEVQVKLTSDILTDFSNIKVKRYGKNHIPYPYSAINQGDSVSQQGVEITCNQDGSLTINGTASANGSLTLSTKMLLADGVTYTLSGGDYSIGVLLYVVYLDENGTSVYKWSGEKLTWNDTYTLKQVYIQFQDGKTFNNYTIYPMIEIGTVPTEYEPYIEPREYSVNAEGYISNESRVTYTESDGNDFVTSSSNENCLVLDTSKFPNDATKLHLVAEFETVAGNGNSHVEFDFTRGVIPSDGIYGIQYDNTNTYDITNVIISEENGFPEKITVTWGVTNLVSYTAEIISGEGEANVKSIYPSMTFVTDTDGVLIDVEYNRDINKAFAELQAAIINLGGTLNV